MAAGTYGRDFYEHISPLSSASADVLVPMFMASYAPTSVVDVGCGLGVWLSKFKQHGVARVRGVDGPHVSRSMLAIESEEFITHDLSRPLPGDLGHFDLAMSLEVAEHLPAMRADAFVRELCGLANVVVFSAAVPGQGGEHHVNEQWPAYWIERFAAAGYRAFDPFRAQILHNQGVAWWYRQNLFVFANEAGIAAHPSLRTAAPVDGEALLVLHPAIANQRTVPVRQAADLLGRSVLAAARRRIRF